MIWHDFMEVALDGHCETFPEPENPVEWIDFNGEYSSDYGSSCVRRQRHRFLEGAYGCSSYDDAYVEEDTSTDDDAYAPGVGQNPLRSPNRSRRRSRRPSPRRRPRPVAPPTGRRRHLPS